LIPAVSPGLVNPVFFLIQAQGLAVSPQVAPLRATVLAAGAGAPVSGATVAVEQKGLREVSALNGEAFISAVPEGPQTVTVSVVGFIPTSVPVTIQTGQTNEVTISLAPQTALGTLKGIVVPGAPPGATSSAATASAALSQPPARTGSGLGGETAPQVATQASAPSCVPPNATPIPGATVALPSPGAPIEATTGADGAFFLTQAPAGTVLVAVRAPGKNPTTQLATIEQDLDNCIVVTLLPTLNADPPTIAVALNAASFRPGQTLDVTVTLAPSASPTQADEYVVGVLPGGQTLLSLIATPAGPTGTAAGAVPFRADFPVPAAVDRVFEYLFGGGEPPGTYQGVGRLVKPGGNFFNPADWLNTTTTSFTFAP